MIAGVRIYPRDIKRDDRGWLVEILRAGNIQPKETISRLYVTVGYPGKTKGGHYHTRKVEWLCIVSGEGRLFLKDVRTGEEDSLALGEKNMVTVCIPPYVAHAITNTGHTPFYLVVAVGDGGDIEGPDTFPYDFAGI